MTILVPDLAGEERHQNQGQKNQHRSSQRLPANYHRRRPMFCIIFQTNRTIFHPPGATTARLRGKTKTSTGPALNASSGTTPERTICRLPSRCHCLGALFSQGCGLMELLWKQPKALELHEVVHHHLGTLALTPRPGARTWNLHVAPSAFVHQVRRGSFSTCLRISRGRFIASSRMAALPSSPAPRGRSRVCKFSTR